MSKSILVHLDGSADDHRRLAFAETVARHFDAHLTGLFANLLPSAFAASDLQHGGAAEIIASLIERARAEGDAIEARLRERFEGLGARWDLRRVDAPRDLLCEKVAREARWADVFVALRPLARGKDPVWVDLVETVLFDAGRAILLVPQEGELSADLARPFVCWTDTRESVRAVGEALPFLVRAGEATIAMVDPDTGVGGQWREPEADLARRLSRHGVKSDFLALAKGGHDVGETLLRAAGERGADLVVLGGYGHSRLREWVLGGVTRTMLEKAKVPLLIAH